MGMLSLFYHSQVLKSQISSGLGYAPIELLTADGYDLQFGTNVIGELKLEYSIAFVCSYLIVLLIQATSTLPSFSYQP